MKRVLTLLITLLMLCYPFLVYYGTQYLSPRYLALGLFALLLQRFLFQKNLKQSPWSLWLIGAAGLIVIISSLIFNQVLMLKLYPCLVNALFLLVFAYTLFYPPTIIERIANLPEEKQTPQAIAYMRKATFAWILFFLLNGSIALWTCFFEPYRVWAIYNGFIAYLLIGLMFTVEFIVRYIIKRHRHE